MRTPTTKLERHVAKWLKDYDGGAQTAYDDLMTRGCQDGTVYHLTHYYQTLPFYARHRYEINNLLASVCAKTGESPMTIFANWDKDDPLALCTQNQNLLAWFGFEETARFLMEESCAAVE